MEKNKTPKKDKQTIIKQNKLWDISYLVILALIVAHEFYYTTMFPIELLDNTTRYFYAAILLYVVLKLVLSKRYTRQEQIFSGIAIAVFAVAGIVTGYLEIIQYVLLIIGAKGIDARKLLGAYAGTAILMLIVAFVASQMGFITDIITYTPRNINGGMRHSFGIIYPTDFSAHVFYIVMAGSCVLALSIDKWKQNIKMIVICAASLVAAGFIFYQCLAFTSTICLIGFVILVLMLGFINKKAEKIYKPVSIILTMAPIILSAMYLALSRFYVAGEGIWEKINKALSNRLVVSHRAMEMYRIKPFGQFIEEQGWGGLTDTSNISDNQYFFLDDSYMRVLYEYGLLVFIITIAVFTVIIKKSADKRQMILLAALTAVAIHCFMEHHMMEIAYNPFLLMLWAVNPEGERLSKEGLAF